MKRLACSLMILSCVAPSYAQERRGWVDPPAKSEASEAKSAPSQPSLTKTVRAPKAPAGAQVGPVRRIASKPSMERHAKSRVPMQAAAPRRGLAARANGRDDAARGSSHMASAARRTVSEYLAAVSSNGTIVSSASRFYADRVAFHGHVMTRAAIAADKARFARRWPDRRYEPRGNAYTTCDAMRGACTVTTAFVFRAANPARGTRSVGIGELTLTVDLAGERPLILSESSRVLQRGAAFSPASRSGDDA